jgi:hypothetical protein
MRPSVMVICGRAIVRPATTSIMRSAVTTTVSALALAEHKRIPIDSAKIHCFITDRS